MKSAVVGAAALLSLFGCNQSTTLERVEPPKIDTPPTSGRWMRARTDPQPSFRVDEKLEVFVNTERDPQGQTLPGLAIGDRSGPQYGLLGGYFAPTFIPFDSAAPFPIQVQTLDERLTLRTGDGAQYTVYRTGDLKTRVLVQGTTLLVVPADRTFVRGTHRGQASFATNITAGPPEIVLQKQASRLSIKTRKKTRILVESNCSRVRIIRPTPRGSTSVFVVQLGPGPTASDPIYAPAEIPAPHADFEACPAVHTATVTFIPRQR